VLAYVGLLFGSDAASTTSGAGAVNAVPASTAPCMAWNLSNNLVYVYSDGRQQCRLRISVARRR
jgi:hypothetical protein